MTAAIDVKAIFDWVEQYLVPFLLLALLAMDFINLRFARKEARERRKHGEAIAKNVEVIKESTEQLTRRDYELTILRGVETAQHRIYCYWHSLHPVAESENYEEINRVLIEKKKDGKDVQLVLASDTKRIAAAYELVEKGVEVHFKESLNVSDLRFSIFDDKTAVFGVPETSIPDGKPSRHGVDLSSRKLNALLAEHFEAEMRDETKSFYEFVASHCREVLKDPTNSIAMVAEQLDVDPCVIEKACPEESRKKKEEEKG